MADHQVAVFWFLYRIASVAKNLACMEKGEGSSCVNLSTAEVHRFLTCHLTLKKDGVIELSPLGWLYVHTFKLYYMY